jgi:N-carbamoylputrescine amidase
MRLGLAVIQIENFNISKNIVEIEKILKKAQKMKVDLLCFGEAVLNGFDGLSWDKNTDLNYNAISLESSIFNRLIKLSKIHKVDLGIGYFEAWKTKIYDSYAIVGSNGILSNYRRVSYCWKDVNADLETYLEGKTFTTFNYMGKNFGILICDDMWFDENIGTMNRLNCDYVLWPTAISYSKKNWNLKTKYEYANQVKKISLDTFFINSINQNFFGGAIHFNKCGEIISELDMEKTGILKIDL